MKTNLQAKMRLYLFNHKFNTHNNAIFSLSQRQKHHTHVDRCTWIRRQKLYDPIIIDLTRYLTQRNIPLQGFFFPKRHYEALFGMTRKVSVTLAGRARLTEQKCLICINLINLQLFPPPEFSNNYLVYTDWQDKTRTRYILYLSKHYQFLSTFHY